MPIEYEIIESQRLIIAKGSGVITGEEILDHLETLANDYRYISPMKKLVDYRLVDNIAVSTDEQWQIADRKKDLNPKFDGEKCAFISPKDINFGQSRVHQALVEGYNLSTEVFRSVKDALSWLDVMLDDDFD